MKIIAPTAIVVFCCIAPGQLVAAQPGGWYAGVAVGRSTLDMTTRDWDDGTLTEMSLKKSDIAYKILGGYRFTPHLAGELSYVHFGDGKFTAFKPGVTPSIWKPGNVFGRAEAKGVSLTGVLSQSFWDRLAVFVSGGVLMWNTTISSEPTLSGGTLALSDQQIFHDNGIRFIYGAGADVRVYRQWRVRVAWEHATVRFAGIMDRGVDFPSVGVTLDF
jgi:opacity protein-like surface antigen